MVNQQAMAIWRSLGDLGHADAASGACNVFDNKVGAAAHGFAHGFSQVTRNAVGWATCNEWHCQ
jgi:hypothetical protein